MISNRLKCIAALLVAFMLLALPAGASDLVESGENISCDDGAGNDTLILSVEEDPAPAGEVAAASTDVSITTYWKNALRKYDFSVTIGGAPQEQYYLFIEDAGISDAGYPLIKMGWPGVDVIGDAPFPDAPAAAFANERRATNGTHFPDRTAAIVQTSDSGTGTVGLSTSLNTVPRPFTISVVDPEDENKNDAVGVTIQEGEVTITAEGAGTYYLGEEIRLSGTNTNTDEVFLFMTGWNLGNANGVSLEDIGLKTDLDIDGAVRCDVGSDDTWEYRWDTSAIDAHLNQGTYTVYAVSKRENADGLVSKGNLKDVKYQTIGVYLKEPKVTLDDGASMVAGGDEFTVSGYADGDPDEVLIWIVGKECPAFGVVAPVQSDGSFEYTLGGDVTRNLPDGQYFVVVQHPRYDGVFNVCPDPEEGKPYQIRDGAGGRIDLGDRLPSEAVATLLSAIEGSGSDDIHAETSFTVDDDGMTVAVEGLGVFVLGDEVTISGINTGSEKVYLFLTGGDLGDGVAPDDLGAAASEGNYVVCGVAADDTWEYRWDTAALRGALAAGTYTLYAADRDHDLGGHAVDRSHLDGVRNSTAALTLKPPTLSASFNRSTYILKGEGLEVSGTATGSPATVRLWALGNDSKVADVSVPVADDGTYEYVLGTGESAALSGDVRVLVQHPMMDGVFNVCPAPAEGKPYQIEDAAGNLIDLGPLSASEAEDVLVDAMTASGSDDHYNALSIMIGEHGVTAAFEGDGNYAIGDTITFSGTAADTDTLYLFVHGPNLGDGCPPDNLGTPVSKGRYGVCEVATDGTWEYKWDTSSTVWLPDSGIYTLYVAATDHDIYGHYADAAHLHGVRHAAVGVYLHKPTLTAALDHSSIRQGDALLISGAATGSPETLQLWIFGANRRVVGAPVPVADDGTFAYTLKASETKKLSGSYSVIVQHPMADGVFNVRPSTEAGKKSWLVTAEGETIDLGELSAGDAVAALTDALHSPNSDDSYENLSFVVTKAGAPSGGGGGGGGGGGAAPRPPAQPIPQVVEQIGSAYLEGGANGTVEAGTVVLTAEKRGSLSLNAGITARDLFGRPLERVSVKQVSAGSLPDTGDDDTLRQVGPGLKCGPDGATFDPAAEIVFTLTEDEWESLGTGEEFVVRWYNAKTDAWEPLRTKVNPAKRQVIARAPHFTTFAVFAEAASAPVAPAETTSVGATKTVSAGAQVETSDGVPTTEEPVSSGSAPWMTVAGVGAALVLAGVICAFWKRR